MKLTIDLEENSVSVSAPRKIYSPDAVKIAAHVFSSRAEVYSATTAAAHQLTLVAKRRGSNAEALEALGGEFLNEALNQEYRFIVARFNRKVADLIAAQALLSARGGENPKVQAPDSEELKAQTQLLMQAAAEEIRRTMPKKILPQGSPIPPEVNAR